MSASRTQIMATCCRRQRRERTSRGKNLTWAGGIGNLYSTPGFEMTDASHTTVDVGRSRLALEDSSSRTSGQSACCKCSQGERQVKAYPRTQTDRRTVGKAHGRRIIGAFRKVLFGATFRFV